MLSRKSAAAAVACIALLGAGAAPARAGTVRFELTYSGQPFDNDATGTGYVVFDDAKLPNRQVDLDRAPASTLGIAAFSLTLSGTGIGRVTVGLADYPLGWTWRLGAPVDFGRDLVGQAGFVDFNLCANPGDCRAADVPLAFRQRSIQSTILESGRVLQLTSMRAVGAAPSGVPEPHSLALVGLSLLGLAAIRRLPGR